MKRYKSHRQRKGREPLWQKKLLSESVDKVQTMAAEMREDKVKQLFFTSCALCSLQALCIMHEVIHNCATSDNCEI